MKLSQCELLMLHLVSVNICQWVTPQPRELAWNQKNCPFGIDVFPFSKGVFSGSILL